ncbi:ABC transporter ATP-binding protein [Chlorobium sp. BLA1]|uniref:ABC transporter ATP-binding protein n=1 Tax=Candidatus Chlorobium masyuteum TaxID=2716876 RepID=UPI00141FE55D|nr:ABC transporter ATP-binding protein [Candidatus Chlorobium masyuteum]NHQ60442.1 ABC transporter ATP-binding protein [Candidatus Chlorobium masyuteum]NTU43980.1 ABC transporter ATP-binding protein [Chlorobiaceae bacterium]
MLKIENLQAGYGEMVVLRNINISLSEGEIVSVVGSNGAGKSTLLKAVSGIIKSSGTITFNHQPLSGLQAHRIVQRGVVHVPEGRKIFPEMTVLENLMMGGFLCQKDRTENLERVYALFPILAERRKQLGGTMSGGEQQMLAIGRGLMASPKLFLLDEPSLGLSPLFTDVVFKAIRAINKSGVTVLLVEQNVYQSLKISHRGYVIETGSIVLSGTGEELLNNPEVKKAFLGM